MTTNLLQLVKALIYLLCFIIFVRHKKLIFTYKFFQPVTMFQSKSLWDLPLYERTHNKTFSST